LVHTEPTAFLSEFYWWFLGNYILGVISSYRVIHDSLF
jgi:hypothetical protein